MALGHSTLGEKGWGGDMPRKVTVTPPQLPPLPVPSKRKTLTATEIAPGKVKMTYTMSIQKPKNAPDVTTEVTVGQMKIKITPTATPGWSMLTVETAVDKT